MFSAVTFTTEAANQNPTEQQQAFDSNLMENAHKRSAQEPELPHELQEELQRAEVEGDSRFFGAFGNMLLILAGIVLFIYLVKWAFQLISPQQGLSNKRGSPMIAIIGKYPLTPRTTIFVLNLMGKKIALSESLHGVTVLAEFDTELMGTQPQIDPRANLERHRESGMDDKKIE